MTAFYNEHDPKAAAWLRELIKQGHIAPGVVDERSIEDIAPDELAGFAQCHFFAGIGVWSYALRRAGWPDDRPVWTGSCPCQPFSAAGKGAGFADERHLWPAWHWLIEQCRPGVVFGEQVASKDGLAWLDLVQADMERTGYAIGALDICAAGFGAPHIRQRLYFVADADDARSQGRRLLPERAAEQPSRAGGVAGRMGNAESLGRAGRSHDDDAGRRQFASGFAGEAGGLADATIIGRERGRSGEEGNQSGAQQRPDGLCDAGERPGPVNGLWRASDWLHCTDGKWRPVEPGTFPLVDGSAFRVDSGSAFAGKSRVAMLRGAGNAIVAPVAQAFIESYLESVMA